MSGLAEAGRYLGQTMRMMVGVPDYDRYLNHMEINHPDQEPMSYRAFFQDRQDARYGGQNGRPGACC
jgi:uncharacterized short protein YbdD (DUF466 family)